MSTTSPTRESAEECTLSPGSPFAEPQVGFKTLLSKWKTQDTSVAPPLFQQSFTTKKFGRAKAKQSFKEKVEQQTSQIPKKILRHPVNIYQKASAPQDTPATVTKKTPQELELLRKAVSGNFVFDGLTPNNMEDLLVAFEKCSFKRGATIIQQGEPGDYFYCIQDGKVEFIVDGKRVGSAGPGKSFGELALLYTCPRAATVKAFGDAETILFRVGQQTFQQILQSQAQSSQTEKLQMLMKIDFCKDLAKGDLLTLSSVMTPYLFQPGQYIVRKGDPGDAFFIIQDGKICCKDISVGSTCYADQQLGPGEYFGERSLVTNEPRAANVVAMTHGMAFKIDRSTFESVLGSMSNVILRAQDVRRLMGVPILKRANLRSRQMASLAATIQDFSFKAGEVIQKKGDMIVPSFFLVREGCVELGGEKVCAGGFFGERSLEQAIKKNKDIIEARNDAVACEDCEKVVLGRIHLNDFRTAFDLDVLKDDTCTFCDFDSEHMGSSEFTESSHKLGDFRRIAILGQGSFGQVWLVCDKEEDQPERTYALKIMSKRHLLEEGQASAIIQERNILRRLRHPFLIEFVSCFQDGSFLYLVMDFVRGGELFSLMHDEANNNRLNEKYASFYAICVQDALSFMHRKQIVFRDLKPENIMIDESGYPVIIDFGMAKFVEEKTYTLCGTPAYLAPEIINCRGHSWAVDNWALGILICEMVTGENPFFYHGIDQMALFQSIVKDEPDIGDMSETCLDLVLRLLEKDPTLRLGSLRRGERQIAEHPWFGHLDINRLRKRKEEAPWVPEFDSIIDIGYFDDWSGLGDMLVEGDRQPLADNEEAMFRDF